MTTIYIYIPIFPGLFRQFFQDHFMIISEVRWGMNIQWPCNDWSRLRTELPIPSINLRPIDIRPYKAYEFLEDPTIYMVKFIWYIYGSSMIFGSWVDLPLTKWRYVCWWQLPVSSTQVALMWKSTALSSMAARCVLRFVGWLWHELLAIKLIPTINTYIFIFYIYMYILYIHVTCIYIYIHIYLYNNSSSTTHE